MSSAHNSDFTNKNRSRAHLGGNTYAVACGEGGCGYGLMSPLPMLHWHAMWFCSSLLCSMDACGFWRQAGVKDAGGREELWRARLGQSFWGWRAMTAPKDSSRTWLSLFLTLFLLSSGVPRHWHWPVFSLVTILLLLSRGWSLVYNQIPYLSCFGKKYILFLRFSKLNVAAELSHVIFAVRNYRIPDDYTL